MSATSLEIRAGLTAREVLGVWERGSAQPPVLRPLVMLAAALPEVDSADLASLSMGRRDQCLLDLRAATFGTRLECRARCPHCSEQIELSFEISEISSSVTPVEHDTASIAGHRVRYRVPNTSDLVEAARTGTIEAARSMLLSRCILDAERDGQPVKPSDLPGPVVEALIEAMAKADPQADIRLGLRCPACQAEWSAKFDVGSFLWREISADALRLLHEVHALAWAYGWREGDILAMGALRRRTYLELLE